MQQKTDRYDRGARDKERSRGDKDRTDKMKGADGRRREVGDEWLYGVNPVMEALKSGRPVLNVYIFFGRHKDVKYIEDEARGKGIAVKNEPITFFDSRFPKGHQGVAAKVGERAYVSLEDLLEIPGSRNEPAFFLALDGVEDPRNFGAILRSAESAGVHGVVIEKHGSAGFGPIVSKSSAGASEHIAVCMLPNIKHAISAMKEEGIAIVGAEADKGVAPWSVDLSNPICLIVGGEDSGLRRTVSEKCDALLSLPIVGKVGSLNASVAAGVFIYEILRQRTRK